MNEKLSFIYPQYEFNDTAATLLFKKNSDYYYDKEMTKKINKSDMFDLFVNGNLLVVDSNGKYTKVASCTEDGTIKEAGVGGEVDPAVITDAVNDYLDEHPVSGEIELPSNIISSKSDVQLRPTVIFSFDQPSIDARATILEENGFRGVYAWRPTSTNPGVDDMLALCQRGHDFSVYGGDGNLLPWTSTKDEWKAYIKPCLDRMAEVGVKYPTMYSCSQHTSTPELTDACKELGFKYVRCGVIKNVDPIQYANWETNNPSYEYFFPFGIAGRTFEYMKDKIDTAIANNYRLVIFAHTPTYDNYSEELFAQIVEYVKSKVDLGVLDVLTPKEYYDKYQREADYQKMLTAYLNANPDSSDPTDIDFSDIEGGANND